MKTMPIYDTIMNATSIYLYRILFLTVTIIIMVNNNICYNKFIQSAIIVKFDVI